MEADVYTTKGILGDAESRTVQGRFFLFRKFLAKLPSIFRNIFTFDNFRRLLRISKVIQISKTDTDRRQLKISKLVNINKVDNQWRKM